MLTVMVSALGGSKKWETDLISGHFLGKVYSIDLENCSRETKAAMSVARVR